MQIIKLLKENEGDLAQIYDLMRFKPDDVEFITALIKMAYNEGLADGRADAKQELYSFAEKLGYFLQIEKQDK
jgi:DNA-binding protein YbaB